MIRCFASLHRSIQIQPKSVVYKCIRPGLATDYWSVIDRNLPFVQPFSPISRERRSVDSQAVGALIEAIKHLGSVFQKHLLGPSICAFDSTPRHGEPPKDAVSSNRKKPPHTGAQQTSTPARTDRSNFTRKQTLKTRGPRHEDASEGVLQEYG